MIQIGFPYKSLPIHPLATKESLDYSTEVLGPHRQTISIYDYLLTHHGKRIKKNQQKETFVIEDENGGFTILSLEEVNKKISSGQKFQILALNEIGNQFQNVRAVVQGYDPQNPLSGFERPNTSEGPHMVLGIFGYSDENRLRLFRHQQIRNGKAYVDTIRGFADAKTLENGELLYDIEHSEERILSNILKLTKEEGGEKVKIKNIYYVGKSSGNSTHEEGYTPFFAVEIDYNCFRKLSFVVTKEEMERREREFQHEGLTEYFIDMSALEFVGYSLNPLVDKDRTADYCNHIIFEHHITESWLKLM